MTTLRHAGSAYGSGTQYGNQQYKGTGITASCGRCQKQLVVGHTPHKVHRVLGRVCIPCHDALTTKKGDKNAA